MIFNHYKAIWVNCQEINKTNIRFKTDGFKCGEVEQSERLRHGCMREKIVIYSRLRAWRVEGAAGDVNPWLDTDTMSHSILYIRGGNRMALMTIGQVSEMLGVSARMLRYYEKEGLVGSMHRENYAYRVYDEDAVRRIRQIVLLRRLQMPLKRIRVIMDGSAREAAGMVQEQIADMERNLASMGTIRTALERLRELLGEGDSPSDRAWERENRLGSSCCRRARWLPSGISERTRRRRWEASWTGSSAERGFTGKSRTPACSASIRLTARGMAGATAMRTG